MKTYFCIGCGRKCISHVYDKGSLPKFCNKTGEEIDFWVEYIEKSAENKIKELKKVLCYE